MTTVPNKVIPLLLIAAAASIIIPLVHPINGYLLNLFMQAATYALAVLGLTVVLGYAGQISIAQAGFFGLGAYGVAIGTTVLHLPFLVALLLGVLVAGLLMTTGPVLNQTPAGLSPPSLLNVYAPSRTCRSLNVCACATPAARWTISTQHSCVQSNQPTSGELGGKFKLDSIAADAIAFVRFKRYVVG